MLELHRLAPAPEAGGNYSAHIDVAAAMTGVSRFLHLREGSWRYSKDESKSLDYSAFTHLLTSDPQPRLSEFQIISNVSAFSRIDYRNLEIETKPAIFVMKRKAAVAQPAPAAAGTQGRTGTSQGLKPIVLWSQKRDKVLLTVELSDARDVRVQFSPKALLLTAHVQGDGKRMDYSLDLNLFREIDPERSEFEVGKRWIKIKMIKEEGGEDKPFWKRLHSEKDLRLPFVRIDWDNWTEDPRFDIWDEEEEGAGDRRNHRRQSQQGQHAGRVRAGAGGKKISQALNRLPEIESMRQRIEKLVLGSKGSPYSDARNPAFFSNVAATVLGLAAFALFFVD